MRCSVKVARVPPIIKARNIEMIKPITKLRKVRIIHFNQLLCFLNRYYMSKSLLLLSFRNLDDTMSTAVLLFLNGFSNN